MHVGGFVKLKGRQVMSLRHDIGRVILARAVIALVLPSQVSTPQHLPRPTQMRPGMSVDDQRFGRNLPHEAQ